MASLAPLSGLLGKKRAAHLLRRTTFKVNPTRINEFAGMTAEQAVNQLFTFPNFVLPDGPISWVTGNAWYTDYNDIGLEFEDQYKAMMGWTIHELKEDTSARSKIMVFLHTCFIAGIRNYFYPYYQYRLLWLYANGNLQELAEKFTKDNLTLDFLNGMLSTATAPNEDYAREFLELFTIQKGDQAGEGDYTTYTEEDVQQAARVFTGYTRIPGTIDISTLLPTGFADISRHDAGNKTFSHRFNNQTILGAKSAEDMDRELKDFIAMVYNQDATALSFASRIYRYFLKEDIDTEAQNDIVTPLANQLKAGNYELEPILKVLLKSTHFYDADDSNSDDETIGAKIKSPLELLLESLNFFNVPLPDPSTETEALYKDFYGNGVIPYFLKVLHMPPFDPPDVKGYDAYTEGPSFSKHWFGSDTIGTRYKLGESLTGGALIFNTGTYKWPIKLDVVDFFTNNFSNLNNAHQLVTQITEYAFPQTLEAERFDQFYTLFLGGLDEANWQFEWDNFISTNDDSGVKPPLEALVHAIFNSPEYQTY